MSQDDRSIERFVTSVRRRLNRHRLWSTLIWTVAAAAGVFVIIGVLYTSRGYAVPGLAVAGTPAVAVVSASLAFLLRLLTPEAAAQAADRFYRLHDAITSYLHFSQSGRSDGYYALQAVQTESRVKPLNPQDIKYGPPQRGLLLAACLVAIAVPLGMRGPSDGVLRQEQLAADTERATAAINEQLQTLVDELSDDVMASEEQELLDPSQLREWVKALEETEDQKEALRQYTQLERKLNQARLAIQNKRDEQLLERAARELENNRETQPLAEKLKQKDYDQAAENLQNMQPKEEASFQKQQKELAKLKATAQHMAAAARAVAASTPKESANAKQSSSKSSGSGGRSSDKSSDSSGTGGGEMAEAMEQLAEAVANLDGALDKAERQEKQQGKCDSECKKQCQACQKSACDALSNLSNQLKKLAMCQRTDERLCKLCRACSQCQSQCAGTCNSPKAGGKYAGWGSNEARRDEREELVDNGQTTQLQGQKGQGPSVTSTESAEEGSGVSTRNETNRQRTFQRQYESFVAREDIPEQVKEGVKHYFEVIHNVTPPVTRQESSNEETTPHERSGN